MKELNQLIDQASNWHTESPVAEVHRVLQICNACRYCEGFCSVFQAMTRRIDFSRTDIHYFANLCHNCGACLHACQYAPPHEFQVNIPKAMAEVRLETYQSYAFPKTMGYLYTKFQVPTVLALMSILTIVFWYLSNAISANGDPNSAFYQIFSHNVLVFIFGIPFVLLGSALLISAQVNHRFNGNNTVFG